MNQHLTEDVYDTGNFMTLFYWIISKRVDLKEGFKDSRIPGFE